MKTKLILTGAMVAILMLGAYGVGCASEEPAVSHDGSTMDYVSFIDNLRQAGATVEPAGEVSQPFFAVTGNRIVVNGDDVQVFEYTDTSAAEAEAAPVSADGCEVGSTSKGGVYMLEWVAPPHFYKEGKLIVLYVGDSEAVTDVLESVLGQQFAGRSDGLEDITWILESYGEPESLQIVLEGTEITALFDSAESQVTGSAGANHYFGSYQISKDKLSIQEIAHTEMYRLDPEGVMEQEDYYLKTLQSAESYEIEDGKLQITSGNQVLIFRNSLDEIPFDINPDPSVYFPQLKMRSGVFMEALLIGELVLEDGYLRIDGTLIIWQPDYFVNNNDGTIEILDRNGEVVARVGEEIGMGGGEIKPIDYINKLLKEPLPADSKGPYWLMGEIVPMD